MAVKRDYGSFSKACAKRLSPMVSSLGYINHSGSCFYRDRGALRDVFSFQQSQWGSGRFCAYLGIAIPSSEGFWGGENDGLRNVIGDRLQPDGSFRTGDHWWPAENTEQLESSLQGFVRSLELADPWLRSFKSIDDIFFEYLKDIGPRESRGGWPDTTLMRLAFLQIAAGRINEAAEYLLEAKRVVNQSIEDEREKHLDHPRTRKKPFVPYYLYPSRLETIDKALAFILEQKGTC